MKLSRYNIWLDDLDDTEIKLCYNSISGGFAKVAPELNKLIEYIIGENFTIENLNEDDKDSFHNLLSGSIIVADEADEELNKYLIKSEYEYLRNIYSTNVLGLTILPTLECNCKCTYCYQNNKNHSMSPDTINSIVKFVEDNIKHNSIKGLFINWYGGEPLLMYDDIVNLSKKFIDLCKSNNIHYSANMISNCTLLTKDRALELKECKIKDIQVTFDGPRVIHDRRRPFNNSKGTFDVIAKNIKDCIGIVSFAVRVNINKDNIGYIDDFFIDFKDIVDVKGGYGFYPGKLSSTVTTTCANIENECLDNKEFSRFVPIFYSHVLKNGFSLSQYPSPRHGGCCATSPHSLVIQPDGSLCRCWSQVGELRESYGNINNPYHLTNPENYYKWMLFNPYKIENCIKCIYFPICKSGCPATHIKATTDYMKGNNTNNHCCESIYNIKEMLLMHYRVSKANSSVQATKL